MLSMRVLKLTIGDVSCYFFCSYRVFTAFLWFLFFFLNGRAATWNWLVYDERSKCCELWSHLCVCSSIINNHISISRLRIPWASYQRPEQIDPQVLTRTYFSHFKLFLHFPSRIVLIQRGKTGSTFWHIKVKESIKNYFSGPVSSKLN